MNRNEIAALIMQNIEGEAAAIKGYEQLLALDVLTQEQRAVIEEIISDEKNHAKKLEAMTEELDHIEAAAD